MVETRLRGPRGSRASLMFDNGVSDVGVSVERRAESGQPATVGNLPTMFVRVDESERRTPARRHGRRDSLQRLDAGGGSAVSPAPWSVSALPTASSSICAAIPAAWRR